MSAKRPEILENVSRETLDRLRLFEAVLRKWNARINLVGPREIEVLWARHIADSLRLIPHLPPVGTIVDLGSGAGFPGLIVGIASGRQVTLVEADQRKVAFLRECVRALDVPATIIGTRIEACGVHDAGTVTARALARLPRLLEMASPLLGRDGVCLFLKGQGVAAELTDARRQWQMDVACHAGAFDHHGCLLEVTHLRRVKAV